MVPDRYNTIYLIANIFKLIIYLQIGKSYHFYPLIFKHTRSSSIIGKCFRLKMLTAIQFNHQLC